MGVTAVVTMRSPSRGSCGVRHPWYALHACMHTCMSTVLSAHAYIYMHDEHGVYFLLVRASFQCHHVQQRGLPSSWEEEVFSCWLWQCHSSRPQQTHTWEEEGHAIGPDGLGRLPAAGVAARHHHRPRE